MHKYEEMSMRKITRNEVTYVVVVTNLSTLHGREEMATHAGVS